MRLTTLPGHRIQSWPQDLVWFHDTGILRGMIRSFARLARQKRSS